MYVSGHLESVYIGTWFFPQPGSFLQSLPYTIILSAKGMDVRGNVSIQKYNPFTVTILRSKVAFVPF